MKKPLMPAAAERRDAQPLHHCRAMPADTPPLRCHYYACRGHISIRLPPRHAPLIAPDDRHFTVTHDTPHYTASQPIHASHYFRAAFFITATPLIPPRFRCRAPLPDACASANDADASVSRRCFLFAVATRCLRATSPPMHDCLMLPVYPDIRRQPIQH